MKKIKQITHLFFVAFILTCASITAQNQNNVVHPIDTLINGQRIGNPAMSPQNGNSSLGLSYSNQLCGLNYVTGSQMITTRYNPYAISTFGTGLPTSVTVSGLPANAVVVQAFIWWVCSYQSGSSITPTVTVTNPNATVVTFPAALIGADGPKCWGETGTRVFRADVTSNVIPCDGVYNIDITGNSVWEVDGCTMMIIYQDPAATWQGSIYIADGCMSVQGGNLTPTLTGFNACSASNTGRAFLMASDLQDNVATTHPTTLNGVTTNFPQNFWNFDEAPSTVFAGQSSANYGVNMSSDCFTIDLIGIYYQTTTCTVCNPPIQPTIAITGVNPTCSVPTGSASVVISNSPGPFSYSWNTVPVQTGATATGLTPGTYTCSVTIAGACIPLILTANVTIVPGNGFTINALTVPTNCTGPNSGIAGVDIPVGGTPPFTYVWSPSVGNTATVSNIPAGTYTCTIADATGCIDTISMVVGPPIPFSAFVYLPIDVSCFGGSDGALTAGVSGGTAPFTYSWNTVPPQTNMTALNLTAGTYSVTVTDAIGCSGSGGGSVAQPTVVVSNISAQTNITCNGGSDGTATVNVVGGTPGYTYSWSTNPIQTNALANGLSAGTYVVTSTDLNGCTVTSSVTIVNPAPIVPAAMGNSTICVGQSATISANANGGTPPYTFSWDNGFTGPSQSVSPIVTTTYTVVTTDANHCAGPPQTVTITLSPPLTVLASPGVVICAGLSANISATGTGGDGNFSFAWTPAGAGPGPISVSPVNTTNYTVTMSDGCGSPSVSDVVTVIVIPPPTVLFSGTNLQGCVSLTSNFMDNSTVAIGNIVSWVWNYGDGGSDITAAPTHTFTADGSYDVTLTVTSSNGCVSTQTTTQFVTVYPLPIANFLTDPPFSDVLTPKIHFYDNSTNGFSYIWDFGDHTTGSIDKNPTHLFADPNTYIVTETVTSPFGCVDTVTEFVKIDPVYTFFIPSAFSPDHDGKNDVFTGVGSGINEFHMNIFDRWGQEIYETNDYNKPWDGSAVSSTEPAPLGVYVYKIQITDLNGLDHSYFGKVSLLR